MNKVTGRNGLAAMKNQSAFLDTCTIKNHQKKAFIPSLQELVYSNICWVMASGNNR